MKAPDFFPVEQPPYRGSMFDGLDDLLLVGVVVAPLAAGLILVFFVFGAIAAVVLGAVLLLFGLVVTAFGPL